MAMTEFSSKRVRISHLKWDESMFKVQTSVLFQYFCPMSAKGKFHYMSYLNLKARYSTDTTLDWRILPSAAHNAPMYRMINMVLIFDRWRTASFFLLLCLKILLISVLYHVGLPKDRLLSHCQTEHRSQFLLDPWSDRQIIIFVHWSVRVIEPWALFHDWTELKDVKMISVPLPENNDCIRWCILHLSHSLGDEREKLWIWGRIFCTISVVPCEGAI